MIPETRPEDIAAWDKAHVWHPFTPMGPYLDGDPVVIQRGEGVRIQDIHGNWYYDGSSSVWVNVHGHNDADLNQAVRDQLDHISHSTLLGQGNVPSTLLARRLVEAAPEGLVRVFFSDSGATAVEAALKIAIQYWANLGQDKKKHVLGFTTNYHGDTLGAMSVAPYEAFHWPFLDLLHPNPRVPYPYIYRYPGRPDEDECCRQSLAEVDRALAENHDSLAAVIVEPVQGAGGIIPAPRGFLAGLRRTCDRHEVLLIVDEVATGFGRTGPLFACHDEDVTPDLLCLGKGITGGYLPVAATLATDRIFEAFLGERRRTFFHGHSYTGNQLGCAVGLKSLERLAALLPEQPRKIEWIAGRLESFRDLPFVGDVRHRGFMMGFELVMDQESRTPFPAEAAAGYAVTDAARSRGLLIRPIGNVVIFMPPLASTREELEEMLSILQASFEAAAPSLETLAGNGK